MAHQDEKTEYIHKRTRNPLLVARAAWRLVKDLGATREATILEDYFSRATWMKKYSRWDVVGERFLPGALSEQQLAELPRLPYLDLDELEASCAPGSVGHTVATHMKKCGLNPNIFRPAEVRSKEDYAVVHLTETHDIWHVVTGFGNDEPGEIGDRLLLREHWRLDICSSASRSTSKHSPVQSRQAQRPFRRNCRGLARGQASQAALWHRLDYTVA